MRDNYFLVLLLFFTSCSNEKDECSDIVPEYDIRQVEYVHESEDTVIYEPGEIRVKKLRHIYKKNRKFNYSTKYFDSDGELLTETIIELKNSGCRISFAPQYQDLAYYTYLTKDIDMVKFKDHPLYNNYIDNGAIHIEGIIENVEQIWLHPPRHNQFVFTELCPFPEASLPLIDQKTWNKQLSINNFAEWSNLFIDTNYEVEGKVFHDIFSNGKKTECWIIKSKSSFSNKSCSLKTLFNKDYGFVLLSYQNHIGEKLTLDLISVKN